MKTLILISTMIFSLSAISGVSEEVLVRGKIGSSFDDKKVQVIDSFGQKYDLPKSAFPKGFVFKQGTLFQVEVSEKDIQNVKVKRK